MPGHRNPKPGDTKELRIKGGKIMHSAINPLTKKIFLTIKPPGDGDYLADKDRIIWWLKKHYSLSPVTFPYELLPKIYPLCREANWEITITLAYSDSGWKVINLEKGDTQNRHYGLAVDLGSTTVVIELVDLQTGKVLEKQSHFNKQITYGEDILSRIFYAQGSSNALQEIQDSTLATLGELIRELQKSTGVNKEEIGMTVISGNTTMIHFLLGLNPWTVFHYPYAPIVNETGFLKADIFDLPLNPNSLIYCMPSVGNYLGGDIVSGILASGLHRQEEISLFLDIGTNGEVVIGNKDWLLAGAGAAGPALEGGVVKSGMRASPGAIERIKIDPKDLHLEMRIIEGGKPKGLCGSAIADLVAQLFLNRIIDSAGKFIPGSASRVVTREEQYAFVYAWPGESATGDELLLTQIDLNNFLDTKAAAHTMVTYLLGAINLNLAQIEKFYTAGAFGTYLDLESAITIGIYPDLPREKFVSLGNSSLTGARTLLLHREALAEIKTIQERITYLELGAAEDYLHKMFAARFLPHTDLDLYPTVKEKLGLKEPLKVNTI